MSNSNIPFEISKKQAILNKIAYLKKVFEKAEGIKDDPQLNVDKEMLRRLIQKMERRIK